LKKKSVNSASILRTGKRHHQLVVRTLSRSSTIGELHFGWQRMRCALGKSGRQARKREGDGATPIGSWSLREAFYRTDRLGRPRTGLALRAVTATDGWCDDPGDRNYNRRVEHPYRVSAEHLRRGDGLYDIIVVLGYNDRPCIKGRGSAIFLHCAHDGYAATQGCIAIERRDLVRLMGRLHRGLNLTIGF
jgi:L,D-peptidoglycan transpeptidase YkuD (ErfK/YbiS/YcfS/YnhG family)